MTFRQSKDWVSIISMCQVNTVKGHTLNEAKLSSKTFLVPKQTEAKIESENKVTQAHWAPKWETNHGLLTDRAVTSNLQMRILFLFKRIVITRPLLFLQLVLQSTDSRGPGFRTQWAFMLQHSFSSVLTKLLTLWSQYNTARATALHAFSQSFKHTAIY